MTLYTRCGTPFEVDEQDAALVLTRHWRLDKQWHYVMTGSLPVHRFILGNAPAGLLWDHKDRDKFNNRRNNLRAVTPVINGRNRGLQRNSLSGVLGVNASRWGTWIVLIKVDRQQIRVGSFKTFEEAIEARKNAEEHYWGDQR